MEKGRTRIRPLHKCQQAAQRTEKRATHIAHRRRQPPRAIAVSHRKKTRKEAKETRPRFFAAAAFLTISPLAIPLRVRTINKEISCTAPL